MDQTLVSVIIPCHQQGGLLREAVGSVLAQDDVHAEIVIVDDGSTDDTPLIVDELRDGAPNRIKVIHQSNQGQVAARDHGLAIACGGIVCFLDADDLLEPGSLACIRQVFASHPWIHVVVGNALLVDHANKTVLRVSSQARRPDWPGILRRNPYGAPAAVFVRRECIATVGGVDAGVEAGAEDWDLWARLVRCRMRFLPVQQPLARYRQSLSSHSHAPLAGLKPYMQMLDFASASDPRLDKCDEPVRPPITARQKAVFANARLFFHLGKAVGVQGGADPGVSHVDDSCDEIFGLLQSGGLDVRQCSDQFLEGLHFIGLGHSGDVGSFEGIAAGLLERIGREVDAFYPASITRRLVDEIGQSLAHPRRKRSLIARLQERFAWLH